MTVRSSEQAGRSTDQAGTSTDEIGTDRHATTWAVVVLHHPDADLCRAQWESLVDQVDGVIYVDNGAGAGVLAGTAGVLAGTGGMPTASTGPAVSEQPSRPVVEVTSGHGNLGVAGGVNLGVKRAMARGASRVLLLDQDSVPAPGMVKVLGDILDSDARIAGAGPSIKDALEDRTEHFVRLRLPTNLRIPAGSQSHPFDVDFLITSGSLLRCGLIGSIGGMDERLFIDSVDFEWSFRAKAAGYRLVATFATYLEHRRGDSIRRIGPLPIRLHSAARLYYMYRNRVRLYFRPYVPVEWKAHDIVRMILKAILILLFVPRRKTHLGGIVRGGLAGLRRGLAERGESTDSLALLSGLHPATALPPYSVLISVYAGDRPDWLDVALRSLRDQTLPAAEVVVVEDGDLGPELSATLDRWSDELPIQRLPLATNQGLSKALQAGLGKCRYEIVGRMDADDYSEPDRFEAQVGALVGRPEVSVLGGHAAEFEDDPEACYGVRRVPVGATRVARSARWRCPVNHPSVVFRRPDVLAAGGYEGFVGIEDYYLWARMLTAGLAIDNLDRIVVRLRAGQALRRRRGGWQYARQETALFRSFVAMGFMGWPQAVAGLALRVPLRVVPGPARVLAYRTVLRKRIVDATEPPERLDAPAG